MNPEPRSTSENPGRSTFWLWRLVLGLFALVLGVMGYLLYLLGPTGVQTNITLERGQGANEVGRMLQEAGLVRSGQLFALYLRTSGRDDQLKPGVYSLEGNGIRRIAASLTTNAQPLLVRITFPEGWRASEMAERLNQNGLDGNGFLQYVNNPPSKPDFVSGATLEGFLFPATYTFSLDLTAEEIVQQMLNRFRLELSQANLDASSALGLSVQDWVTLASIVQAEAANSAEKPAIAGVFLNRLAINMRLQADPTVAYGLGKKLSELNRNTGDFQSNSPYNTYRVNGLPPGAIGNPGREALQAVLKAQTTNEQGQKLLYFFHAQNRLFLNPDFESHQRDLQRYR